MPDLAELLRGAREDAGLSLQELAARTKIKVSTLEAMERGDFDLLPRGIFMRGFLKASAHELHLDPDFVVATYSLERGEPAGHAVPPPALAPPNPLLAEPTAVHRLWRPFAAAIAFLLFVILLTRNGPDSTRDAVTPRPVATTGIEAAREANFIPKPPQAGQQARTDGVRVVVRAAGPLWLEATADGKRVVYRLMLAGERAEIAARNDVILRAGDAAAMAYTIDGRPGRQLGPSGAVRSARITPDNAPTFLR